jgi:hypothetical protein
LELRFGTFFNECIHDLRIGYDTGALQAARKVLSRVPGVGAFLDQARRKQARDIVERIPATKRHRYIFRYMIDALGEEI